MMALIIMDIVSGDILKATNDNDIDEVDTIIKDRDIEIIYCLEKKNSNIIKCAKDNEVILRINDKDKNMNGNYPILHNYEHNNIRLFEYYSTLNEKNNKGGTPLQKGFKNEIKILINIIICYAEIFNFDLKSK
ncbi:hypothetical protein PIROE2DRAFT_18512 [Piromyces sp. E2]|nr:hypothetical protein PIROE2DRAFT_18512 [Piromyces sp. E2]|eukprot:OUM56744.1 hypothetical protein PIROE2DRAFT_18512 [Piromyces sp. E2]